MLSFAAFTQHNRLKKQPLLRAAVFCLKLTLVLLSVYQYNFNTAILRLAFGSGV